MEGQIILNGVTVDQLLNLMEERIGSRLETSPAAWVPEQPADIHGVAAHLKLEQQTIYRMVRKNDIPYHKKGSRLYFFLSEINEWIKTSST